MVCWVSFSCCRERHLVLGATGPVEGTGAYLGPRTPLAATPDLLIAAPERDRARWQRLSGKDRPMLTLVLAESESSS